MRYSIGEVKTNIIFTSVKITSAINSMEQMRPIKHYYTIMKKC